MYYSYNITNIMHYICMCFNNITNIIYYFNNITNIIYYFDNITNIMYYICMCFVPNLCESFQ